MNLRHPWRAFTLALLCFGIALPAQAQLVETFDTAVPPVGWAKFDNGNGTAQEWVRITGGVAPADGFAESRYENVTAGLAEDYLATPLLEVTAAENTLSFANWQAFGSNFGSTYEVMVSTGSQDTIGDYVSVASWDEVTQCPGPGTITSTTTAVPSEANCEVDLSAYDGQQIYVAFKHSNDDGDNFRLDSVTGPSVFVPAGAVFNLSPTDADFGTVAQCGTASETFTISNTGNGDLDISSIVLAGDTEFALVNDMATGSTLALGEAATFDVEFSPLADGTFSAAATVSYSLDGGPTETDDIALDGLGDIENVNAGIGDGYTYGNSTVCAGDAEATPLMVPFGLAEGDTEVTLTDDQVTPSIPLGTRIRLFGQPHNNMFIASNGWIGFGPATTNSFYSATSGYTGVLLNSIDLNPSSGGQIFYGFRDVTGNPGLEVIVTFYRVPFFSGGGYITAQAIISPSSTRGGNSSVVMQYINGIDPADGEPFSVATSAQMTSSVSALVGDQAGLASLYSGNSTLVAMYGGSDTIAVEYSPRSEEIVTGDAGWRLLSHGPTSAPSTIYLVEQNLVQGLSDEYPANDVNLYTGYDGTDYAVPADASAALTAGKGLFWYFFDRTQNPASTAGESNSIALPAALVAGGEPAVGDVTVALTAGLDPDGVHSEMLGNPFETPISGDDLVFNAGDASQVAMVYDPVTNDFSPAAGNEIPVWGGFFVDAGTATEVVIPDPNAPVAKTTEEAPETRRVAFELSGTRADGSIVMDRGAVLAFADAATTEWDALDAAELAVPGARVELAIEGGVRGGATRPRAQASFPLNGAAVAEMSVGAVGTDGELTLRWDAITNVPEDWTMQLRDLVTGAVIDLRTESEYVFTVEASAKTEADEAADTGLTPPVPTAKTGAPVRFVVEVTPSGVVSNENGDVTEFALESARPNPMRGSATVRFAIPEAGDVEVALYDLLGRRVAVLAQGELGAGWHDVSIDADALSAGVYVLRMQTDGFSDTQRVTVVR